MKTATAPRHPRPQRREGEHLDQRGRSELKGDRREGYRALRAYLHTLRDRLPADQNARSPRSCRC